MPVLRIFNAFSRLRGLPLQLLINILSMPHLDDPNGQFGILNGIHNPVKSLTNPVFFPAGKLFMARRVRVDGKGTNLVHDPFDVFLWDCFQILQIQMEPGTSFFFK